MKDYTPAKVIERTPREHLRRAEVLMAQIDNYWGEDGALAANVAYFTFTPPALTLAQLHIQLAHAKVASGEWTW